MKKTLVLCLLLVFIFFSAFIISSKEDKPVPIPPSKQRTGNPSKGYEYLVTGDYIKSGIPFNAYLFAAGMDANNYLERAGINKKISYQFTAVKAANGEIVVAPNCLQCHAQVFDNQLVIGLG